MLGMQLLVLFILVPYVLYWIYLLIKNEDGSITFAGSINNGLSVIGVIVGFAFAAVSTLFMVGLIGDWLGTDDVHWIVLVFLYFVIIYFFYFMFCNVVWPILNKFLGLVEIKERNNEVSELSKSDNSSEK